MRKYIKEFTMRGLLVCWLGPVIWAIVYAILNASGVVDSLSVRKTVVEILSVTVLAFVAGGIGVIYKVERMPLALAALVHALVLYADYVIIYLMNGWLGSGITSFAVFTACFVVGFAAIWLTIYFTTKRSADEINSRLRDIQSDTN